MANALRRCREPAWCRAFTGKPVATNYSYEETMYPKFIMNWAPLRGIHTADWMYVRAPKPELYDLKTDPAELHNVIEAHPKEYRELDTQLKLLIGNNGTEKVVSQQMDEQTMAEAAFAGIPGRLIAAVGHHGQHGCGS